MANESKIEKSGLLEYHNNGLRGQGKTIIVLDEPPHLRQTMDKHYFFAPLGWRESDIGCRGHAAYCAQVIHEAAPEAKIILLPFMARSDRENSIKWLQEHKGEYDIINMSLNLASADAFYPALQELNVPVVAAAGNKGFGENYDVAKPACFDWTIAVGGYNEGTKQAYEDNTSGKNMDCVAFTYVEVETKPGRWVPFTGTSCAAPWLAGMLACYYTNVSTPDVYAVRDLIKAHCVDIAAVGKDNVSGYGFFKLPMLAEREELMTKTKIILELDKAIAMVNNKKTHLDCTPFAQDGRTFVPLRFVAETLGCAVDYKDGIITITKD